MIRAIDTRRFPVPPKVPNRRSMVHVDDVALAARLAAMHPEACGRTFIITDGQQYSTRDMFEWICEALERPVPSRSLPLGMFKALAGAGDLLGAIARRRMPFNTAAFDKLFGSAAYDSSAARSVLGFKPQWSLKRAMPEIVRSVQSASGYASS